MYASAMVGVTGKRHILNFALGSLSQIDHFPDIGKMIGDDYSAAFTGCFGLVNYFHKVVPLGIA